MPVPPLLLGHRGARAEKSIPENSLESFDLALAQGCDGFEFDVRLSADGHGVVCHDPEIRSMAIARSPAEKLRLPTLQEVLSRYQLGAFLDIELKVAGLEKITADLLRRFPPARGFVVSSFLPEVIESVRSIDGKIPLGLICESQLQFKRWNQLPVEYLMLHRKLAEKKFVGDLKSAGKKIFVWTVNLPAEMKRFTKFGVDGIISDHPKLLVQKPATNATKRQQ
jgi:glycerophosphoryl diester phosphodiesterase